MDEFKDLVGKTLDSVSGSVGDDQMRIRHPREAGARAGTRKEAMRKIKTSVDKQETVVAILWQFAKNIQANPEKGCVATSQDGTRLSLDHVRDALEKVMDNFGYATVSIR